MGWVEKDHNGHLVSTPCSVQGRQPPDQAAQSHIQPGLERLQGWGIHNILRQPVTVRHHLLCKKLPPKKTPFYTKLCKKLPPKTSIIKKKK